MEAKKKRYGVKHANGYGSIRKLSGKTRRRPWQVLITVGWEEVNGRKKQIQKALGYYAKREEAVAALVDYNRNPHELASAITFKDVYEKLNTARKSNSKISAMKTAYRRSEPLHNLYIKDIKKPHLQAIADSMVEMSKSSQAEVRILWNAIFKYGLENDLIDKDYSKFVDWESDFVPGEKLPFTADDVKRFSDDLKILCFTGMRISEYLAVKTEDIKDGCIYVYGTKTGSAVRVIPIHHKIAEIVNQRLAGVYLCEGKNGQMSYSYFIVQKFNPEMQRLGLAEHTVHDCRRTFATYSRRSKLDETIIKRLIGHKITDITNGVYATDFIDALKKEMAKLEIV